MNMSVTFRFNITYPYIVVDGAITDNTVTAVVKMGRETIRGILYIKRLVIERGEGRAYSLYVHLLVFLYFTG